LDHDTSGQEPHGLPYSALTSLLPDGSGDIGEQTEEKLQELNVNESSGEYSPDYMTSLSFSLTYFVVRTKSCRG
jgi:hypothetical protein